MTEGKRVAIYARVSTADQTAENQLLDLRRHCAVNGWTVVEEFVDTGVSGAQADREHLGRLMEAVRRGRVDRVLVWRFDRFARSMPHLVAALEEFRRGGVEFTSRCEGIDTGTPHGKMVYHFLAAIAEFERELIIERIHSGLRRARSEGKRLGRCPIPESKAAEVLALRGTGSVRAIAARVGLSKSLVQRLLSTKPIMNVAQVVDGSRVA